MKWVANQFDTQRKAKLLSSFLVKFEEYEKQMKAEKEAETISEPPSVPSPEESAADKIEENEWIEGRPGEKVEL